MKAEKGFAYIALLAILAISALYLSLATESSSHHAKREREKQLFFVGEEFRSAIASYYENSPSGAKQYPRDLDRLLKDNRSIRPVRHLRKVYSDPMTNDFTWGLVKNKQQQIIGVFSFSTEEALITHFDKNKVTIVNDEGILLYSDIKFIYTPKTTKNRGLRKP